MTSSRWATRAPMLPTRSLDPVRKIGRRHGSRRGCDCGDRQGPAKAPRSRSADSIDQRERPAAEVPPGRTGHRSGHPLLEPAPPGRPPLARGHTGGVTTKDQLRLLVDELPDEQVARALALLQAVGQQQPEQGKRGKVPTSLGIGASGRDDVSERVNDVLAEGFGR